MNTTIIILVDVFFIFEKINIQGKNAHPSPWAP